MDLEEQFFTPVDADVCVVPSDDEESETNNDVKDMDNAKICAFNDDETESPDLMDNLNTRKLHWPQLEGTEKT